MEPGAIGARLASSVVFPLIRRLFVSESTGAGLVDKPVRVSGLVSFKGEKRTLSDRELQKIADELVRRAGQSTGVEERMPSYERRAVAHAVADSLRAMGDLDMDDVQAVSLGHLALSQRLRSQSPTATLGLSSDAITLHAAVMDTACLHVLHFFTQRSAFVPRTLVEQSRRLDDLRAKVDALLFRTPSPADTPFEDRYAAYIMSKYGKLTIFGLDFPGVSSVWPLDAAYLSLDAASRAASDVPLLLPADHVLEGRNRVLLRGVAGSGKTTLVQWLAVTATQEEPDESLLYLWGLVPFVLPLRALTRDGASFPTPDQFLAAVGCPLANLQPTGWFDRVLTSGRGLILIDGMDEVPEIERESARRWLQDLLAVYPENRWLITSRPSAVRDEWLADEGFIELDMAPMSRDSVASFIKRWHKAAGIGDQYAPELIREVQAKQALGRLAANPLMCALICALHQDRRGYLPDGRKELYDAALSMLLSRRDRERGIYKPGMIRIGEAHHIQLIQKLAYWMIRNGRVEMGRGDAVDLLAQSLPAIPQVAEQGTPEEIYRHLLVRSGLLREPSVGSMDFIHRTFQDYLGAKAAVEGLDFDFLISNAHLDQWEDVIRMAVAHARPAERVRLLNGLLERGDSSVDGRHRLHLLAAACLEHATELDPSVRDAVQKRAAALIPPRSAEQARALADVGPVALELLPGPQNLHHENKNENEDAENDKASNEDYFTVLAAARIATDAAIPVLARYRSHKDLRVRAELVRVWGRFDTVHFGEEVVAYLDDTNLYFPVSNQRELRELQRYGGRSRIKVVGNISQEDLVDAVSRHRLTHLWVAVDVGWTWEWLSLFTNFQVLTLETSLVSVDVTSLADVRLREVRVPAGVAVLGSENLSPATKIVQEDPIR
ncbi:NACHT domain-containing protein [Streptomyces luomodiensis]|uniref:NACHT domain-containing protein n=1 Tax=Streptomyces luomodiensis TaxID=3026192 RepID=UPI003D7754E6